MARIRQLPLSELILIHGFISKQKCASFMITISYNNSYIPSHILPNFITESCVVRVPYALFVSAVVVVVLTLICAIGSLVRRAQLDMKYSQSSIYM